MAKHLPVGPIKGAQDLWVLLKVFDNHELYAEQLGELESTRKEINDLIELIAPANQIQPMFDEAEVVLKTAKEKAENSKVQTAELVKAAQEMAWKVQSEATRSLEDAERRVALMEKEQKEVVQALAEREVSVAEKENAVAEREAKVRGTEARLADVGKKLELQKANLKAAMREG